MEYHYLAVTNVFEGINTYGIAAFADSDGDAILIESFADLRRTSSPYQDLSLIATSLSLILHSCVTL